MLAVPTARAAPTTYRMFLFLSTQTPSDVDVAAILNASMLANSFLYSGVFLICSRRLAEAASLTPVPIASSSFRPSVADRAAPLEPAWLLAKSSSVFLMAACTGGVCSASPTLPGHLGVSVSPRSNVRTMAWCATSIGSGFSSAMGVFPLCECVRGLPVQCIAGVCDTQGELVVPFFVAERPPLAFAWMRQATRRNRNCLWLDRLSSPKTWWYFSLS